MASIYDHSDTYDLEHSGPQKDVDFFLEYARRWKPRRILEVACGNGRLTIPLARESKSWDGTVTGIDTNENMLDAARRKSGDVEWISADVRTWHAASPFDLVISGCSSLSHLLTAEDQRAAWHNTYDNLGPGGRFIVAEQTADLATLAESMRIPPRVQMVFDGDFQVDGVRLIRQRSVNYRADLQQMHVRYFYDRISEEKIERFVNDYVGHVYFPGELRLLFLGAGFVIENEWGDYDGSSLEHASRVHIICGTRSD